MPTYPQSASIQGHWSLDNVLTDSSGNSNTLTNNNTVAFDASEKKEGTHSADFESGSSQSFSIADASQTGLDITGDLSAACWFRPESNTGSIVAFVSKHDSAVGNQRGFIFYYNWSTGNFVMEISTDGAGGGSVSSSTVAWTPSTSTWYHVAVIYDASAGEVAFYVNGAQQGTTQTGAKTSIFNNTAAFGIGAYNISSATGFMDGLLDDVVIWNAELTGQEISDLYSSFTDDGAEAPSSIDDSTATVKDKFELVTFGQALDRVIELAHEDGRRWYWRLLGDNTFTFKKASATADHTFILGSDVASITYDDDLINGANEVFLYYNNATIRRYKDADNINERGYLSHIQRESNVADTTTADEIGNGVLEDKLPPLNKITVTIMDTYPRGIEFINPGDTCQIINVPEGLNSILSSNMLITKTVYRKDTVDLELDVTEPSAASELEKLRKEFQESRTEGVPTTFTDV